jgi:hypothetical protein
MSYDEAPGKHDITLDHVAYFLPNIGASSDVLSNLGFNLTPFSAQQHRLQAAGPLLPAGTANRCAMLQNGYLECLAPTHDTPNAQQLRSAMARYTGVHLIAFGTAAPAADYQRLEHEGFAPLPPLSLQRESGTVRFTVVRVPPPSMAEGRIQFCQHHTPAMMWQPRWMTHANRAVGLAGVLLCVADPVATAARYARFTGLPVRAAGAGWRLDTARGYLLFVDAVTLGHALGITAPTLPWIAGYVLDSDDMQTTRDVTGGRALGERLCVTLPAAVGGVILFQAAGSAALDLA